MRGLFLTIEHARTLRKKMTDAERLLWRHLRNRSLDGFKFRRQHKIGAYIADFACIEKKIIIEADGGQHAADIEYDAARTGYLNKHGWSVLRFWNTEILQETEAVLNTIYNAIEATSPRPSPP